MVVTKKNYLKGAVLGALAAMGLAFGVMPNQANAATAQYFDVNGTTAGYGIVNGTTYSWEGSYWTSTSGGAAATGAYFQNNGGSTTGFPRFYGGSSGYSYTVDAGADENMVGLYLNSAGVTVTINQTPSTSGQLDVRGSALQGFLVGGTAVIINCPIVGNGGVEQSQSGQLSLFGNNSYAFGTETTGGQTLNYNNVNSFGTGSIQFTGATGQGFVNASGAALTISNPITWGTVGGSTNFVSGSVSGAAGTKFSGAVTLPASGSVNFQAGNATTDITNFSNVISGLSGISVTGPGSIIFSGANQYSGATTLTAGTLKLAVANSIAHSSSVAMNGGSLDTSAATQALIATMSLGGTAVTSTLNVAANGTTEVDFADSHAVAWTSGDTLNVTDFSPSFSLVRFGTTNGGLTSAQLADIELNGDPTTKGLAYLNSSGYLVPEPTSIAMLLLGAPMLAARRRRQA